MSKASFRPKPTAELAEEITNRVCGGMSIIDAARLAGISPSVFYKWKAIGNAESEKRETWDELDSKERSSTPKENRPNAKLDVYVEFVEAIERARLFFKQEAVSHLRSASANGSVSASIFLLERGWPDEYGKQNTKVELSGPNGGPVRQEVTVSDADLLKLANDLMGIGPVLPVILDTEKTQERVAKQIASIKAHLATPIPTVKP